MGAHCGGARPRLRSGPGRAPQSASRAHPWRRSGQNEQRPPEGGPWSMDRAWSRCASRTPTLTARPDALRAASSRAWRRRRRRSRTGVGLPAEDLRPGAASRRPRARGQRSRRAHSGGPEGTSEGIGGRSPLTLPGIGLEDLAQDVVEVDFDFLQDAVRQHQTCLTNETPPPLPGFVRVPGAAGH